MGTMKTFRTGSRKVTVRTGREGPRHDPYAFSEITVKRDDRLRWPGGLCTEATLHIGLGVWLSLGRQIRHAKDHGEEADAMIHRFEGLLGCSLRAFNRALRRPSEHCCKCGGQAWEHVDGYPGETLVLCKQGHIMDSAFNEDLVI